jgi:hypothetical protein
LTNYSDVNLGCKKRVASGLDWVFQECEEAIILEDDCLPDITFFPFCEELLDKYRNNNMIMAVSGGNFQIKPCSHNSYYFSRYTQIWGWATWQRAWKHYDMNMQLWPLLRDEGWLKNIFMYSSDVKYWEKIFQKCYEGKIDTWDYMWTYSCWINSGLTIIPNSNLVSNIGFGTEATHTKNKTHNFLTSSAEKVFFPLKNPAFIIRDKQSDLLTQRNYFNWSIMKKIKRKVSFMEAIKL